MIIRADRQFIRSIIYVVLFFAASLFVWKKGLGEDCSIICGWIGISVIVWCGFSMKYRTGTWFSLGFMFEIGFYILTMGQSFLCALGIERLLANQYNREPVYDVNRAYLFSMMCLVFFNIGMSICYKKEKLNTTKKDDKRVQLANVGIIVFIVSIIPYLIECFRIFATYRIAGYSAAYSSISGTTSWAKGLAYIANFFPYSVAMLLAAHSNNRQRRNLFSILFIMISAFNFMVGNRSEPISYIFAMMWLYRKTAKTKIEKKHQQGLFVIVSVVIILVIPIIGANRNGGDMSISNIFNSIVGENSVLDITFRTISELGYSVFPAIKTMQLIPEVYPYHYGESYLFSLIAIIPNVLGGTHISQQKSSLAQWLMKTLGMTYGPGYSMPAEAYYNFGWFGIFVMPIFGYLFAKLLREKVDEDNPMGLFISVASFIALFSVSRRDMLSTVREVVWFIGIPCLAVYIMSNLKSR